MTQGEFACTLPARLESGEQPIYRRGFAPERAKQRDIGILCRSHLTPARQGKSSDQAIAFAVRRKECLNLGGGAERASYRFE